MVWQKSTETTKKESYFWRPLVAGWFAWNIHGIHLCRLRKRFPSPTSQVCESLCLMMETCTTIIPNHNQAVFRVPEKNLKITLTSPQELYIAYRLHRSPPLAIHLLFIHLFVLFFCLVDHFSPSDSAEIVSIDAFNRPETRKGLVVGISLILLKVRIWGSAVFLFLSWQNTLAKLWWIVLYKKNHILRFWP